MKSGYRKPFHSLYGFSLIHSHGITTPKGPAHFVIYLDQARGQRWNSPTQSALVAEESIARDCQSIHQQRTAAHVTPVIHIPTHGRKVLKDVP